MPEQTLTYLRVDCGDGVELCVVVERLGESPDGRLLALPLHPAVQHPLAAALQTPAAVALDLKNVQRYTKKERKLLSGFNLRGVIN